MITQKATGRMFLIMAALLPTIGSEQYLAAEREVLPMKIIAYASDLSSQKPLIDAHAPQHLETATFAMG